MPHTSISRSVLLLLVLMLAAFLIACGSDEESAEIDSTEGGPTAPLGDAASGFRLVDFTLGGDQDMGMSGAGGSSGSMGGAPPPGPGVINGCDSNGNGWDSDAARFECEVWELVNQNRRNGYNCDTEMTDFTKSVPEVSFNEELRLAARRHSQDMAQRNYFSHDSPGGPNGANVGERITDAGYNWRTYGENIAAGQPTPEAVMEAWLISDGHCANIMRDSFEELGVGVYLKQGGDAGQYGIYWTQNFGAQ